MGGEVVREQTGQEQYFEGINTDVASFKQAEQELKEAHTVIELAMEGIAKLDDAGRYLFVNRQYAALLGYQPEELVGQSLEITVHPDDRGPVLAAFKQMLAVGRAEVELRDLCKDGRTIYKHVVIVKPDGPTGKMSGHYCFARDITEHKQMENVLRISEERWQLAAKGTNDGFWDWDLVNHRVFYSSRWAAMRGLEDHELTDSEDEWRSRIYPDDLPRVQERLNAYFAKRLPEFCEEYRTLRKDGSYMWVLDRGVAIWDEEGRPIRMAGSESDITERKQEEMFQSAEKRALEMVAMGEGLREVLAFLCETIEVHTAPMRCAIMLVSEDGKHLTSAAAPSLPDAYNRAVDGIPISPMIGSCGSAAHFATRTIAEDILSHPFWSEYAPIAMKHGLCACWSQPILNSNGAILGIFAAYYSEPCTPQPNDLKIVERSAYLAALAIEHAKVAEALRESEARFQAFMDHSPAVTFIKDETGHHLYVSSEFERLFHVSREEVKKKTAFEFLPYAIATRLHQNDQLVLSSGQTLKIQETVPIPDGISQDWLTIKFPLDLASGRRLLGGIAIDITERKQAEEHLRRTRFAMDQAVDAVYWIDPQARILYTNKAASEMLGYTTDEFLRMTVHDLNPNFPPEMWPGFWAETREKKTMSFETVHLAKDGRRIPIDIRVSFLAYDGQEFHCAFVRDITERKRMDAALDALVRGTSAVTGREFFSVFVKELAQALHVRYAGVSVHLCDRPGRAIVLAMWSGEEWAQPFEYGYANTPCDRVFRDGSAFYQSEIREQFPEDEWLVSVRAESYLGLLLRGESGEPLGHIFVLDDKPMVDPKQVMAILQIFAARGAAELARLRADDALLESQERFELAARATNDGLWDWNIVTGELYWSDRSFELLGLEPHAMTPTYATWISLVHPDDADRVHQATCRHLETREPYDIEVRVRMKDGGYRWFRDRGHAVWDSTDRPVRMVGSLSDVTEQKNAEAAILQAHAELELRVDERTAELAQANRLLQDEVAERKSVEEAVHESELRYKLLTEATFDGIAIHDQGVLLDVNAGLERMFGYGPGELMGRSLLDLVAEESRDLVLANMQNGVNGPYEAIGCRKDGTTFPGEVVVRPCCHRGKQVRLVAGRDITARKHLELEWSRHAEELERQVAERSAKIAKLETQRAQAEKLAAMGRLAAGVAHEINNPIAGIKNAFELVKQAVDPAHPHAEFTGMIDREITRVASIVQNMYQLYRPESGKGEPVELQTMVMDIKALFAKRLEQRRLLLAIDIDSRIRWLCVSRGDMLQVLLNLLHNAIDYSSEGGTITLTVREEAEVIRIAVSDQGAGIHPEDLPHIFDPFFTTKTGGDQKGMGLGLSISQSLVTAMGGTIEVQTHPNGGSTFSILLPRHTLVAGAQDQLNIIKEVVIHDY